MLWTSNEPSIIPLTSHECAALRKTPQYAIEQSTCEAPTAVGVSFAVDVLKRSRQLVMVLRECNCGPVAVIRCDPAPACKSPVDDKLLAHHRIAIELGRVKNQNKNPVAEREPSRS